MVRTCYLAADLRPLCGDTRTHRLSPVAEDVTCEMCAEMLATMEAYVRAITRRVRRHAALRWLVPLPRLIVAVPDGL